MFRNIYDRRKKNAIHGIFEIRYGSKKNILKLSGNEISQLFDITILLFKEISPRTDILKNIQNLLSCLIFCDCVPIIINHRNDLSFIAVINAMLKSVFELNPDILNVAFKIFEDDKIVGRFSQIQIEKLFKIIIRDCEIVIRWDKDISDIFVKLIKNILQMEKFEEIIESVDLMSHIFRNMDKSLESATKIRIIN